jgi:hypothetical protein
MDFSELNFGLAWQSSEPELAKEFNVQVSLFSIMSQNLGPI